MNGPNLFSSIKEYICSIKQMSNNTDNQDEIIAKAKLLQTTIIQYLQTELQRDRRQMFDEKFYEKIISIIESENENLLKCYSKNVSGIDFTLNETMLGCVRNSFYKAPENQKYVAEHANLREPLLYVLKTLIDFYPAIKSENGSSEINESTRDVYPEQTKSSLDSVTLVCVTTFVNLMAGNSSVRSLMWPYIRPFILRIVSISTPEVSHTGAALLHQFLLEKEIKCDIMQSDLCTSLLPPLLKSYMAQGSNACFALFCLELLLESTNSVQCLWEKLSCEESLLVLDILASLISKQTNRIPVAVVHFFQEEFKRDGDKILRLHDDCVSSLQPNVSVRMASFLSSAASSDLFRDILQKDKSLLISSVYLLRAITDIGEVSTNAFSRVSDNLDSKESEPERQHPCYGFKSDLIRLIAGLLYKNKDNQDTVRETNGLLLLLENSQYDARNPFIREAAILALRNALEGNLENQKVISSLKLEGVAENGGLDQLGLAATICDGKLQLQQK